MITRLFAILLPVVLSPITALSGPLQGGRAKVNITPSQWPHALIGSFSERLADSAHDPLHARAVVLSDGEDTIAMVLVDNCLIPREPLDKAKELAFQKTGISVDRIMVASTHTHTAPTAKGSDTNEITQAYHEQVVAGIAESIQKAHEAMIPVRVGWGGSSLGDEVHNRRWFLKPGTMPANPFGETTDIVKMNPGTGPNLISPAGPTDPEISVLSLRDAKNKPVALIANYSLHYVGGIPKGQVSADYFGEFARLIGVRLRADSESFVGIMSNGTSGDINNIDFTGKRPPREPFEQIRLVAGRVADVAYFAQKDAEYYADLDIDMRERVVTLQVRKPDADLIERSKAYLAKTGDEEKQLPNLAKAYARRVLDLAEFDDTRALKVQAVRIGDLAICTLPFEVFAEIGLNLKEKSPFADTFTISLANGAFGYLPTTEQHEFGGYETWLSTNRIQKDAADILTKNLLEMLEELHP